MMRLKSMKQLLKQNNILIYYNQKDAINSTWKLEKIFEIIKLLIRTR
jgi:hypothetical protein